MSKRAAGILGVLWIAACGDTTATSATGAGSTGAASSTGDTTGAPTTGGTSTGASTDGGTDSASATGEPTTGSTGAVTSGSTGTTCCTAWPVPSCGSCRTKVGGGWPAPAAERVSAASTSAAPWPVITTTWRAFNPAAVSITCCTSARPANRCNTLGSLLFMRVPLPAAMITTSTAVIQTL